MEWATVCFIYVEMLCVDMCKTDVDAVLSLLSDEDRLEYERQLLLFGNSYIETITKYGVLLSARVIRSEDLRIISRTP